MRPDAGRLTVKRLFKTSESEVRWGWKAAILITGTILFGIILNTVLTIALVIGYSSRGLAREQAIEQASISSGSFTVQTFMTVLQMAFMLWLVRWLVVKIEKQKFNRSDLGLKTAERSKNILSGVLLAVALSLLTVGIGYFAGALDYVGTGFELFSPFQVTTSLLLGAILALASGFGEEIAFRGYLQSRISKRYGANVAILITAVLFALSHPVAGTDNPYLYLASAVLVGILFGTVFVRTGSLWMGMALHSAWNFLQIAILAVRSSADDRFFGAPLLVFENASGTTQMLIEFMVIFAGLLYLSGGMLGRGRVKEFAK
jgi:membrane protease YdiL (CAAX protease family)